MPTIDWKHDEKADELILLIDGKERGRIPHPSQVQMDSGQPGGSLVDLGTLQQEMVATGLSKMVEEYKLQLAEYINSRKRLIQSAEVEKKYASEPLVKDLLMAFDNLDRALEAARKAGDNGPLAGGVSATANQFLDILRRHGVTRIETNPGDAFDPNRHEAVSQQPAEGIEAGHIAQILQQGFLLHDRVLRPAAVIVAS